MEISAKTLRRNTINKLYFNWPALRYGRPLTRLSTKQLEAKERQFERMMSNERRKYLESL